MKNIKLLLYLQLVIILILGCSPHIEKYSVKELQYNDVLEVAKRTDWGWQPLEKALPEHQINKITIHHGGVDFPEDKNPVQYLQNLQTWSRSDEKNWIDIPYHFMIDLSGKIYEARPINYPGDTNTDYDPTGHALVCVMGNYENQTLSDTQLMSVIKLCVYLAQNFNVKVEDIKGHRDYTNQTVCPGKDLYRYLEDGTIHQKVRELIGSSYKM